MDGKTNAKIQSVFLEKFPIFSAQFSTDGREVIMGGKFSSFFYYDMIVGKVVRVPKLAGKDAFSFYFYGIAIMNVDDPVIVLTCEHD